MMRVIQPGRLIKYLSSHEVLHWSVGGAAFRNACRRRLVTVGRFIDVHEIEIADAEGAHIERWSIEGPPWEPERES